MRDMPKVRRRQRPAARSILGRTGYWVGLAGAAVMAVVAGASAAADDRGGRGAIFTAARDGVANGLVEKSRMLGFRIVKTPFRETPPEGAVLIGFDLGLGNFLKEEVIHAVRPIYLTADGEISSWDFGRFKEDRWSRHKTASTGKVTRTVRVKARPGFAVAGITLRTALSIRGMSLNFMRMRGARLDPQQSYRSDWVGSRTGTEMSVNGSGSPVVGVFGNQDEQHVLALGLIYLKEPAPNAELPADPAPAVQPIERPAAPAQPAEVEKDAPAGPAAPAEERSDKERPGAAGGMSWLPVVVFVGVAVPAFLGCLVFAGRKKQLPDIDPQRSDNAPLRVRPPFSADATAICEKAGRGILPESADPTAFCEHPRLEAEAQLPEIRRVPAGRGRETRPQQQETTTNLGGLQQDQPPFFLVRASSIQPSHLYRVYLLPEEALFLDAGVEKVVPVVLPMGAMYGLIGGLFSGLVSGVLNYLSLKRLEARRLELDRADLDQLLRLAGEEKQSFPVTADELICARIEAQGLWESNSKNSWVGRLHLRHRTRGEFTLDFLNSVEMQAAIEMLPRIFGDRLNVQAVWDEQLLRFVRKP